MHAFLEQDHAEIPVDILEISSPLRIEDSERDLSDLIVIPFSKFLN